MSTESQENQEDLGDRIARFRSVAQVFMSLGVAPDFSRQLAAILDQIADERRTSRLRIEELVGAVTRAGDELESVSESFSRFDSEFGPGWCVTDTGSQAEQVVDELLKQSGELGALRALAEKFEEYKAAHQVGPEPLPGFYLCQGSQGWQFLAEAAPPMTAWSEHFPTRGAACRAATFRAFTAAHLVHEWHGAGEDLAAETREPEPTVEYRDPPESELDPLVEFALEAIRKAFPQWVKGPG